MSISDADRRMLGILADVGYDGIPARAVARRMWPDSPGWLHRSHRSGAGGGGAMAVGMPMRAGSMLTSLERRGLAAGHGSAPAMWTITQAGREAIADGRTDR